MSHIAHLSTSSFVLTPDLHPLHPTPTLLSTYLSTESTLTPNERQTLVNHSLSRACAFADLALLTFILRDERCARWVELEGRDEDGANLITVCISGFRGTEMDGEGEAERELEREECVRLLLKEGADLSAADHSGWTPLHYSALLAPTSLISYLLAHGASPLALSRRHLTPLDVITASEPIPGREGAASILRQAMDSVLTYEERQRMARQGWRGDERREEERRKLERAEIREYKKQCIKEEVADILKGELGDSNWGWADDVDELFEESDLDEEDSDGYDDDTLLTPPDSYSTMLVFSPPALQRIFSALIPIDPPQYRKLRDPLPAQALYLHCRFAATACDHYWLEDLIVGAMDRVEEVVMAKPDDLLSLSHWLFNTTLLLHLLRCDESTSQICEILGLFGLLEEMVNVIYVLVIRIIERRLDPLIDTCLLDHTPPELQEEWDSVQFEGEWDSWTGIIGRVISPKKKPTVSKASNRPGSGTIAPGKGAPSSSAKTAHPPGPGQAPVGGVSVSNSAGSVGSTIIVHGKSSSINGRNPNRSSLPSRPSSPPNPNRLSASNSSAFNTIKGAISSGSLFSTMEAANSTGPSPSPTGSTSNLTVKEAKEAKKVPVQGPQVITTLLTALHTFLSLAGVNPALLVQTFSQVMYWTACEMFNRILQRRKYLCRSRALHIGLNLGVIEEWISGSVGVGLPREVGGHFKVVRELIGWLQCLSSIDQFANLIATVQTFRHLNPLQMRRAVREYRYEVGETKMTEECTQYLAQLQKDWERQRVKMGVEALKKEMGEREGSQSSRGAPVADAMSPQSNSLSNSNSNPVDYVAQQAIDSLFDRTFEKSEWYPAKPPAVLGELLDSRHMLPLLLPSDPMHLGALPVLPRRREIHRESGTTGLMPPSANGGKQGRRSHSRSGSQIGSRSVSVASVGARGAMEWISRPRRLRVVDRQILRHLGDDEVSSELETIAAKWKFAWEGLVTSSSVAGGAGMDGSELMSPTIEKRFEGETKPVEEEYPVLTNEEGEDGPGGGAKLTMERPRIVKERRRASQMFEEH